MTVSSLGLTFHLHCRVSQVFSILNLSWAEMKLFSGDTEVLSDNELITLLQYLTTLINALYL